MNKINITLFFFLLALTFGCGEKELDLQPLSDIGANGYYKTTDEVENAVVAIYDGLQAVPLREFALTEMRTDNARTKSSEGDWAQFQDMNVQPTNLVVGTYWAANYNVVFRANTILANLGVVEDATTQGQFEGEAKFTRALAHFNLVRAYGDIPLIDQVIIQTDVDFFSRDAVADVYSLIVSDLEDAVSMLPSKGNIEDGRATSGAASGLLAKVYLTMGEYTLAETLLSNVITSGDYALEDTYTDIFYDDFNDEILFVIPYVNDDVNESQDFSFEMTAGGVVSGLNYITDDFHAVMDVADTERAAAIISPNNVDEVGKYLTSSSDIRLCGNDWIVLRLADIYLMHAEAILAGGELTTSASAIESYNTVRERVGLSTLATDGSVALTKDMLLEERRVELSFENHRLYDLIRFGRAEDVLGTFADTEGYDFSANDLLLPIPQKEINVSEGKLTQNPGY